MQSSKKVNKNKLVNFSLRGLHSCRVENASDRPAVSLLPLAPYTTRRGFLDIFGLDNHVTHSVC